MLQEEKECFIIQSSVLLRRFRDKEIAGDNFEE